MPKEERFITFNLSEIHKAIVIKCTEEDADLPPEGELVSIEIDEEATDKQDSIDLVIRTKNDEEQKVSYDRKFFALALVFYCRGSGIPLPHRGTKTLKILSDKIIMKIELESAVERIAA